MPIAARLTAFEATLQQCDSLIANAHRLDAAGAPLFPAADQQQITVAAFLNMFIGWETFLEGTLIDYMTGDLTTAGTAPVKFVNPLNANSAREMLVIGGVMRYFDFGQHDNVRKLAKTYFQNGHPYEQPIVTILSHLNDLRTIRNASAHITSTTQVALESLALRIFGQPQGAITVYRLLMSVDPGSANGETVYLTYKSRLQATAALIAQG